MVPILMSGLPACGICRFFPRDIVYVPTKFQGLGLKNIYITMGHLRIDLIASEGNANSTTGGLVRTSIEATKLELGLSSSVFESDFKKFGKLATECWITHSWKFMEEFNITMIEDTPPLALRRVGDKFIIESFNRHRFKGKQLVRLNRCRLFLQVMTLADISTEDG
jgi:hypothetical protein